MRLSCRRSRLAPVVERHVRTRATSVKIATLDFDIYSSKGIEMSHRVPRPTWERIEAAVRELDRFRHPYVILRLREDVMDDEQLEIMGGEGRFWVAASIKGYTQRRLTNPSGGTEEIDVWTSDQGFADEERFISYDIDEVLRVTRHFAEHADFDPTVTWE
jgi:hypothetical protein